MKLIRPYYEILTFPNISELWKIESTGRVCYKSEGAQTGNTYKQFFKNIINRGHEAVLEHSLITVKFICDRGVSHELVRHRLVSICQESSRYCNYSKDKFDNQLTFIIPSWTCINEGEYTKKDCEEICMSDDIAKWFITMATAEETYKVLIEQGWPPEHARSILPNSLKTEVVMSTNIREWRHILKLRTSKKAHPQMRELMTPLLKEFKEKVPELFEDIKED